jgi:hypothetical protein
MQRQQPDPRQLSRRSHTSSDRIGNIVEFQVQEDPKTESRDLRYRSRPFRRKKLASDFEDSRRPAEPARQNGGRPQPVNVQGDD